MSQLGLGLSLSKNKGAVPFNPLSLNPYLLFDSQSSMEGTLEATTLDLDPSVPSSLDVITAARAGVATYTDESGLIQSATANTVRVDHTQGAELTPTVYQRVGYTDFSSGWVGTVTSAAGSGVDGYDSRILTTTGNGQYYQYNIATVADQTYAFSFKARRLSGSGAIEAMMANGVGDSTPSITLTTDWQEFEFTIGGRVGGGNIGIGFLFASSGDSIEFSQPQLEEGTTASSFVANTTGSPKFITGATYGPRVPMMLIEPSATNLLPNSSSFANVNGSINTTGFDAPDGSNDAQKISNINGATDPMVAWSSLATLSPSTQYSGSIFVKGTAGESIRFYLRRAFGGAMANSPYLNVILDGSWQKVEMGSMTTASDNSNGRVFIFQASSGTPADEVYLWGAQLETGSVATSYIPTSGSAATRAKDDLSITGSAFSDFYNTSEGTFYVEGVDRQATGSSHPYIVGQSTSQFFIYKNDGNTLVTNYDGTNILSLGPIVDNQLFRAAVSYKTSGSVKSLSFNGTSEVDQPYSGNFAATNILKIGHGYTDVFSGHFRRIIYWPTHSDSL